MAASLPFKSDERYQAFIQNSHEGIWCVDLGEPIPIDLDFDTQLDMMYERAYMSEANDAMATMYGVDSVDKLIGVRLGQLLIREDPRNEAYLRAFVESGYRLSGVESHERDMHGNERVFRNSLVGVIDDGKIYRAWGTQQDITEQYHAESELRKSQEHLRLALKASRMGTWEMNVATQELIWSDQRKVQFGLKPSDKVTYEKYVSIIHPEDREHVLHTLQHSIENASEYRTEHRVVWPDGSVHWLLSQGKAIQKEGQPARVMGTSMNIDNLKRAEDLKTANAALQSQREQLIGLNKSKDEFISLASHQLRTPSSIVKQYIGMILQGFCGPVSEEHLAFLQIAYENNERQLQIINDLLRVAKVDAGRVILRRQKVDIGALLADMVKEHSAGFKAQGQHIVFDKPVRPVYADIDSLEFRMVLENLIDNAAKYSAKDAITKISLEHDRKTITVKVRDQGVGIAKRDIHKLFQKFSRVENDMSMLVGGTGIGLYWAKKIVDLHGGSIEVQSRLHKGTTFVVTLPKKSA